ncbi:sigma-E factor negative regulatory protein [Massilia glaciei]|uniref:Transcriptional regulator n=1 Tax=Massilia glaciei TaxID=1524097 RepID=A0A2U2HFK4_9BURK|nr:sigma-E factor negative regulatory protein [Massilia glaciei]PWF43136.1 transcriptional regulator [Massilia glaciei]
METNKKIREHISALSDGELPDADVELAFATLDAGDGHQTWNTYHRIGDVLRAQATPELSDAFSAKLAERLAQEATHGRRTPTSNAAPAIADAVPKPAVASIS